MSPLRKIRLGYPKKESHLHLHEGQLDKAQVERMSPRPRSQGWQFFTAPITSFLIQPPQPHDPDLVVLLQHVVCNATKTGTMLPTHTTGKCYCLGLLEPTFLLMIYIFINLMDTRCSETKTLSFSHKTVNTNIYLNICH